MSSWAPESRSDMDLDATFTAHYDEIHGYLVRLTGDADLAADGAQEAFVRLAERPPRRRDNIRAWLYTVATNYVYDTLKVQRRRAEILAETPDGAPVGQPADPPDRSVESAERRAHVRRAMRQLREKERVILELRAQGFSYKEVAEVAGVPINSVGVFAARALRKLAAILEPCEAQLS